VVGRSVRAGMAEPDPPHPALPYLAVLALAAMATLAVAIYLWLNRAEIGRIIDLAPT
jgi:hypothetical protein